MQTKLTIRLDEELIKRAKEYAQRSGRSVSQLVAEYFSLLGVKPKTKSSLTPKVAALKGSLKGQTASTQYYKRYLEEKYR